MVPIEENIDVIEWVADPAEFIYNAIAPAEVDQLSLMKTTANVPWWLFQITSFLCHWSSWTKRALGGSLDWLPYRYQVC